ncbi:hypothetical protein G9A89_017508 [Geosiphon pyriformis]|nr:hypothetical protein G9A89_017508 [Geosiphon pyriformis]
MADQSLLLRESNNSTRVNAAIVVLVRNIEVYELRATMRQLEDRWNKKFHYPYVFLNDKDFTEEFKELISNSTKSETYYGLIPKEMWSYPSWINQTKAEECQNRMEKSGVIYGDSLTYRHMCRFNSGFFFRHPLLDPYDWYWRLEPSVEFACDIDYDPFLFMENNNLAYGFTITFYEFNNTIPTLWQSVRGFMQEYPQYLTPKNVANFIIDNNGDYNLWGDAPVHSIALALFLQKSEIHFFNDIAYKHNLLEHCPDDRKKFHENGKCHCNPVNSVDNHRHSCLERWFKA